MELYYRFNDRFIFICRVVIVNICNYTENILCMYKWISFFKSIFKSNTLIRLCLLIRVLQIFLDTIHHNDFPKRSILEIKWVSLCPPKVFPFQQSVLI